MSKLAPVPATTTCNARTKSGKLCSRRAGDRTDHPGEGRCYLHGGRAGRPPVHGRYSKFAPAKLAERIEQLEEDESLMDLTAEVALVTAMIEQQLSELRESASEQAEAWEQARTLYDVALANAARPEGLRAMNQLGTLLKGGTEIVSRWERIDGMLQRKAQLVQVQGRRLRDQNLMLSVAEVNVFVIRVTSVLTEELSAVKGGDDVLARIGQRIQAFL